MEKSAFAALAAMLAAAAPAQALDNVPTAGGSCLCFCEVEGVNWLAEYDDIGLGCAALNGRTCNVEDHETGGIRTGRTRGCEPDQGTSAADILLDGILQPASPSGPGLAVPLPEAVFQR